MAESNEPETSVQEPPQPGMVQCQITGHWLPEDETVEFQGYRVGAEGKEVLLEQLRSGAGSGQAIRPGAGRRIGCALLDVLLVFVAESAVGIVFMIIEMIPIFSSGQPAPQQIQSMSTRMVMIYFFVALATMLYYGLMHGARGATIGKTVGKLKVVNRDGSSITMATAMWRSFLYIGPWLMMNVIAFAVLMIATPGALWPMITNDILELAVFAYLLADLIVALVDSQQQRALHDRLAGTRVIYLDA